MIISGTTTSKLLLIKGYDENEPYQIGKNFVVNLTNDYVEYKIENILYRTYFDGELTYFWFEIDISKEQSNLFNKVVYDDSFDYDDKMQTQSFINIQRNNFSVYEKFYYMAEIKNLGDFANIPQTIIKF